MYALPPEASKWRVIVGKAQLIFMPFDGVYIMLHSSAVVFGGGEDKQLQIDDSQPFVRGFPVCV